jgi:hypothetical protein
MTGPDAGAPPWRLVDEGWGRKAVDFATLSEPGNCREYVAVHHRLGVDAGDGCSTWRAGQGSPWNWLACAALPAAVSMPQPG